MTETVNAATARVYTYMDWSVFPLWWIESGRCACPNGRLPDTHKDYCGARSDGTVSGSPGKHPITRNGVKDASRDLDTVTARWKRFPFANIGLPAGDNDLAIIDVDPAKGGDESLAELNAYAGSKGVDLMATLTQHTGGDGLHLVYAAPEGGIKNNANSFGPDLPGLDTRGRGGYIVAWPSMHISGGRYEWVDFGADIAPWPDILTPIVDPPKLPPVERTEYKRPRNAVGYAAKALQSEVDGVLAANVGNRNNRLHLAAFNLGQLIAASKLDANTVSRELLSAALAIGLGERESLATIDSGFDGGRAKPRMGL